MIQMRDGVRLATDIYVPSEDGVKPAPGRFPVLLMRTPYNKGQYPEYRTDTRGGYIVAIQDVRGRFRSEGIFRPMLNEANDGYDTVAWLIKQPWSDGRIGTLGGSYLGGDQILLAAERPPGLVAGFAEVAATDQFKNEWVYMDGALALSTAVSWTIGQAGDIGPRLPPAEAELLKADSADLGIPVMDGAAVRPEALTKLFGALPLRDIPIVRHMPWWSEWLDNWDNPRYFHSNDTRDRLQNIDAPFLHVGGWFDFFLRNTIDHYQGISSDAKASSIRSSQRLVIGPWGHAGSQIAEANANSDIRAMQLAWMDRWFKGKTNAVFDHPVVLYVMGENQWRAEDSWPLPGTQLTPFYLHSAAAADTASSSAVLSTSKPAEASPSRFAYDPRNPAPRLDLTSQARSREEHNVDRARSDALVFTSPQLTEDVEVTGKVSATLYAASSATDTDWWIKLIDVAPDGRAYVLTSGLSRARYRSSRTAPQPLTPGKIEKYAIDLWATSNVFKKGHRIRVEVTSSNYPWTDRNPNAFVDLAKATEKDFVVASQTVYHDADRPSHVLLPIIPQSRARQWIEAPFPRTAASRE